LRVLGLPPGSLESLTPLSSLDQLTSVSFLDNRVTSLAPLSNKPNLRTIDASGNAIASASDLTLPAQQCGRLELTAVPLSEAAQDDLQRFCAVGWYVTWGETGTPVSCNDTCQPRP
jgi:Leucine-rich repeat (LRR) protein